MKRFPCGEWYGLEGGSWPLQHVHLLYIYTETPKMDAGALSKVLRWALEMSKGLDKYASRVSSDNSLPDPAKESVIVYLFRSCSDGTRGMEMRHKNQKLMVLFSSQVLPHFPCFSRFYFFNNFLLAFFSSWSPKCGSAACMTNFKGSQRAGSQCWASVTRWHTELPRMADTCGQRRPFQRSH